MQTVAAPDAGHVLETAAQDAGKLSNTQSTLPAESAVMLTFGGRGHSCPHVCLQHTNGIHGECGEFIACGHACRHRVRPTRIVITQWCADGSTCVVIFDSKPYLQENRLCVACHPVVLIATFVVYSGATLVDVTIIVRCVQLIWSSSAIPMQGVCVCVQG